MRNAADLALLTREQELVALSAKKILAAANESQPKEKLLARAEDVLQKRIQEDSVADTARVEETTAVAEDNSVKEVDEVHKVNIKIYLSRKFWHNLTFSLKHYIYRFSDCFKKIAFLLSSLMEVRLALPNRELS